MSMKYHMFTRTRMIIVALALSPIPPAVLARSTVLVEPDPVTIGCSLPAEKMQEGIKSGGAMRHWIVVSQNPGNTELQYAKGSKHVITVNVSYTANTFAITYKDSSGLNYAVSDDGTRRIHPRPVGWMKNLSGDIQGSTNNLCQK
jgi:hypothetical protein